MNKENCALKLVDEIIRFMGCMALLLRDVTIYGMYGFVMLCNWKQELEYPDSYRWKSSILNIDICTRVYGVHDVHFGLM